MKIFIGILSTIIILTGAVLTVLSLWNIYPISWMVIFKAGLTIAIVCVTILLMWLIKTIFFDKSIFNKMRGNNTHPRP
ncbi:MAG: hypothetical protein QM660_07840 [Dysgonomonas sp.]